MVISDCSLHIVLRNSLLSCNSHGGVTLYIPTRQLNFVRRTKLKIYIYMLLVQHCYFRMSHNFY